MQGGLRMYNIVVCCVSALSSSILVSKMKEVAREKGVKALIWTVGEAGLDLAWAEADAVLLTPQVRHLKEKLEDVLHTISFSAPIYYEKFDDKIYVRKERMINKLNY